jgi:hypothetical protein
MSNTMTSSPPLSGPRCALAGCHGVSVLGSWVWLSPGIRLHSKKKKKKKVQMMEEEAKVALCEFLVG